MSNEIEDSTWNEENIERLNDFEENRNLVLRATRKLFSDFYHQNFQGDEIVLEVGSGTGFLRRNWPNEFHGEWIQLDSQVAFLEEAKKRFPDGTYINGSAYELPFPDESLDLVCGYGAYDVLMDLETAIIEVARVLKKGGLFFHMLDLYPNDSPIKRDLERRRIPLQIKTYIDPKGHSHTKSISFVPEEKIERFIQASPNLKNVDLEDFGFEADERVWNRYAQEVQTHDYFAGKIIQALSMYFDPTTIENGKEIAMFEGERTEQQRKGNGKLFSFLNDAGTYYSGKKYRLLDIKYRLMNSISSSLATSSEPSCTEFSSVRYAKARK